MLSEPEEVPGELSPLLNRKQRYSKSSLQSKIGAPGEYRISSHIFTGYLVLNIKLEINFVHEVTSSLIRILSVDLCHNIKLIFFLLMLLHTILCGGTVPGDHIIFPWCSNVPFPEQM